MSFIKKTRLLSVALLTCYSAFAQQKQLFNGDFESTDQPGIPSGWAESFTKAQGKQYAITLDSTVKMHGRYAASIARIAAEGSYGVVTYVIPKTFQGKEISLRGFLKTENVTGFAGMWLRIDGFDGVLAFDNMQNQAVSGTSEFKEYSITLPYDDGKALKIYTGVLLAGGGRLWADDLRLFIDGKPIDQATMKTIQLKKAQTDAAFSKSSGLNQFVPSRQQVTNLAQLARVWGFVKYYHPSVAKGEFNMDAELFRLLPQVLTASNNTELSDALEVWVDKLGTPENCKSCNILPVKNIYKKPNYKGLLDVSILRPSLIRKLQFILDHHQSPEHYYVDIADKGMGSPVFNERPYSAMSYPDAGYRLLTLFRYWNMIEYFYPDKHLTGTRWDDILQEYIPRFISAGNETAYALTSLSLIGCIHDTHANIWYNPAIENFKGRYGLPFQARFIEGKLVVCGYYTDSARAGRQLIPGDIITAINGKKIDELLKKYLEFSPASNYAAQLRDLPKNFLMRSNDPQFSLEVISEGQVSKAVVAGIENSKIDYTLDINPDPQAPAYKMLAGNIGYLFPGRYKNTDLPQIKQLFGPTKGIIIDMRCYPSDFMPFTFVPFVKTGNSNFVQFTAGSADHPGTFRISSVLNSKGENAYKGRVIVIVNEYTQSQAEYTTMAFQSSPNVQVIGSTTAGTDGNICNIILPGGIQTYMSGIGVLYPDGTETQRKGVKINYVIRPTISGIKNGRDELLEKAKALIAAN